MKFKPFLILFILPLVAILLSACSGSSAGVATGWPGLSTDKDTAYLAYNRQVYAINLENGQEKWRYPAKADAKLSFYSAPTLTADGQLLVGSYSNVLYSLDPLNGSEKWSFAEAKNRYIGSPLAVEAGIFAPNADEYLYALNYNGQLRWKFHTRGAQWATPTADAKCTCIYLSSMDHRVYSIDAQTGQLNWQTDDLGGAIVGQPALSAEGVLYVGTFGSQMYALEAETGQVIWKTPTSSWVWAGPALQNGRLYFGVLDGTFLVLEASSGNIIWQYKADGAITDTPLVTEDTIYFTTEAGSVIALDLNGNVRWTKNLAAKLHTSPVLDGDLILIATTSPEESVVALDKDGNQRWVFAPEAKK